MNSKRRAELQRNLSMGAVPRPPAGLSDRIKADIPQYLQTEVDRARFSASVAFSMRIAASILLLITTAFVTLRIMQPPAQQVVSFDARPQLPPPTFTRHPDAPAGVTSDVQPIGQEVRLDIAESGAVPAVVPPPQVAVAFPLADDQADADAGARKRRDEAMSLRSSAELAATGMASENDFSPSEPEAAPVPADVRFESIEEVRPQVRSASADLPAQNTAKSRPAAPERMVAAAAAAPASATVEEKITVTASAPLIGTAQASSFSLRQNPQVFGISVDPGVFQAMKDALRSGKRPPPSSVNVDALVNYFAGPPARAPRRGVALEVEVSPAPVEADGDHAVLRFTIDTPRIEVGPRSSTPPAVNDARIEIEMDGTAVASFRRIGGSAPVVAESTLPHNLSVTGLYHLELRPRLRARQRVATIRLHYRSIVDGKPDVITRVVYGSDLARDWERATRRHRLASLGAVWGESLKTAAVHAGVAKRAEELATQEPADSRARELANAASVTSGGDH